MKNNMAKIGYAYLFGDTTWENIREAVKAIDECNKNKDVTEINLVMNSWGGPFYPSFGLYDHIRHSKKPVDIIVEGTCQSCGVLILQAGRKRISMPNTVFMVHPSNYKSDNWLPYSTFISEADQYKKEHEIFVKLTIERCGITKKEFEKLYTPQKFMTPEEALKFGPNGLIDIIL